MKDGEGKIYPTYELNLFEKNRFYSLLKYYNQLIIN